MAAVFRVAARLGWNEQIGNHNSLMLPGRMNAAFLINPRGYLFQELTASSLIVCDLDGRVLRGNRRAAQGGVPYPRPDPSAKAGATCIVHVHPRWLTALSMLASREVTLAHHNNLILNDRIAMDHGGVAPADSHAEGDRLAAAMGDKSILVMGGHGVTVVGPTVHDAFDECSSPSGPRCISSPRCPPAGRCARCPSRSAATGTVPGARRSMRACIWTPGGASSTARNRITQPECYSARCSTGRGDGVGVGELLSVIMLILPLS